MSQLKPKTGDMVNRDADIVSKTKHNFKTKIGNEYSTKGKIIH